MKSNEKQMTDEQYRQWLASEEGGIWLANEIKKKLYEYEVLIKLSRERIKTRK